MTIDLWPFRPIPILSIKSCVGPISSEVFPVLSLTVIATVQKLALACPQIFWLCKAYSLERVELIISIRCPLPRVTGIPSTRDCRLAYLLAMP